MTKMYIRKIKKVKEIICIKCNIEKPREFFRSINACYLDKCIKCYK